jgi:hypothetical protein
MIRFLHIIHPKKWPKWEIELDLGLALAVIGFIAAVSYLAHCREHDVCIDWLLKWFA